MIRSKTAGGIGAVMAAAALACCFAARPALAHHSFASYEAKQQIKFTGKVTSFEWANPHVYIEMDAPDGSGQMRHWLIECANPGILNRVGWKWNMIREGDEISVIVSPLRNGEPGALLKAVRLADGATYGNGGPAGPATLSFDE
jgi:hypothetical protein